MSYEIANHALDEIIKFDSSLRIPVMQLRAKKASTARMIIAINTLARLLWLAKSLSAIDEDLFDEQLALAMPALIFAEFMPRFVASAIEFDTLIYEADLDGLLPKLVVSARKARILERINA